MSKLKKSTDFFAAAAEKAEEKQDKIEKKAVSKASSADDKLVQLSVYVPESYRKRARMAALKEDRSVSDAVREFLETWFEEAGV